MINKETIISVSKLLSLSAIGNEQDFSVEFADKNRVQDFIEVMKISTLSSLERYAILSLILASYDDYLNEFEDGTLWEEIVKILDSESGAYEHLLNYWALWNEKENWFNITPMIRSYLEDRPSRRN